jgi:hypothetical protein
MSARSGTATGAGTAASADVVAGSPAGGVRDGLRPRRPIPFQPDLSSRKVADSITSPHDADPILLP